MEGCENPKHFPVITLCGSARFKDEFMEVQKRLTLAGYIVISVGFFDLDGNLEALKNDMRQMLGRMHFQRIDMADEIYVLDVGGYVGESTNREIQYAENQGKKVRYYSLDNFKA